MDKCPQERILRVNTSGLPLNSCPRQCFELILAGEAFEAVEAHVHWVYSAYILMSMMKIEGGLTARKNALSKVIRMNPSQVLGRKIKTFLGQFGGREKIRELVAAVVQGKAAA
ncbi:MAG: hypothetical protein H7318_00570 [Oligoflexus sp.]|nr:hypothetical protein [Oligoflexus sp.]